MESRKMNRIIRKSCAIVLLTAVAALADTAPTPGNPDTNASDQNYDTQQPNSVPGGMQKTEDGANRAMNKVDRGVHKGINKTKRGTRRAKHKAKKTADEMSEPANKPAGSY